MKSLATLLIAAATGIACADGAGKITIESSAANDSVVCHSITVPEIVTGNRGAIKQQVIMLDNGKASIDIPKEGMSISIYGPGLFGRSADRLLVGPDDNITVVATPEALSVTGNATVEGIMEYNAEGDSIQKILAKMDRNDPAVRTVYESYIKRADSRIADNLDSPFGLFLISEGTIELAEKYVDDIAESVQTSYLAPIYEEILKTVDNYRSTLAAREKIKEGLPAPDFTLPDLSGKQVSLSSLKGKWIILDFWGAWCHWCIKGMPQLKEFAASYKDKCDVVGIDCNDSPETWAQAVKTHGLDWLQLANNPAPGFQSATVMYGIQGFPTKFLIDKEGKIALVCVGEDLTFFDKVKALIK